MRRTGSDIRAVEFIPLYEVKARLSEKIRQILRHAKKIAITQNGRPTAILMSYQDYLAFLDLQDQPAESKVIDFAQWKRERKNRLRVRDSLVKLFDTTKLSRKGQKPYKKETVDELNKT